ncbi:Peptidase M28 family protein [Zea mays]|uniref:Aminopeptidase NAALADL1 n=1 Tax=Zea mays TaxID=4577 RepID=A0A1D6GCA5_MAIZE|nr:Peptidase M28 family protein [Zea mays]
MPPPQDGVDDSAARVPLLPPPAPRRAAVRLHPLPLLIAATLAASYRLLFLAPAPSYYQSLLLSLGSNDTAAAHLHALTIRPHLAGTGANALAAAHVAATLSSHSFRTRLTSYSVLLSYPAYRSLSLSAPDRDTVLFALKQETYAGDPYEAVSAEAVPTFLAYAASGSVSAEAVYANYGRAEDFAYLAARGIDVTGKVAVARYGEVFRGDIVRNARDAGAAAAVIYSDAKDYAAGKTFPDGPWMPPTGVQVGSTFKGVGDPTTPMWASSEGCERLTIAEAMSSDDMPGIPALPVSWKDGETILQLIGGDVAPENWQGGDGAAAYRYVILGNHRDAWTFGAVDPNSGTASLLELAQRLSELQKKGWRPRRTIILCNWDAEEYGLTGSTEWVEENRAMLTSRTVAYLNVDSAVAGHGFYASATPQLDELLKEASKQLCKGYSPKISTIRGTKSSFDFACAVISINYSVSKHFLFSLLLRKVQNPDNGTQSLYDLWMSSNSSPLVNYPVYHSLYDDFIWMEKFGDPLFQRHVAVGPCYQNGALGISERVQGMPVSLSPLHKSIKEFRKAVAKVDSELKALQTWKIWSPWRNNPLKVRDINDRLMMTERAFTDREGLSGRPWYKHLIYAPSLHNDYGAEVYPGIGDAIERVKKTNTSESLQSIQHEIYRVSRVINQAALVLSGGLT